MKSFLSTAVLVTTIISVSSSFNNKCARESDGATFRHPDSEQLYLICFNGETVEVKCRDNYNYNEQIGKCLLTIDVQGENPTTFNPCLNTEGLTLAPSETSCRHFHFCFNGVDQGESVCPSNQLFDPILLNCFSSEEVNCNPWTTTISTTLVETTSTTEIFTTTTEVTTTVDTTIESTTADDTTPEDATTTETTTNEQTAENSVTTTTIFETTELTEELTTEVSTVTTEQTTIGTTTDYPTTQPTTITTNKESSNPTEGTTSIVTTTSEETTEIYVTSTTDSETTEATEEITPEISTVTTEQTTIDTTIVDPTTTPSMTTTNQVSVCYEIPDTHLVNNPASCDAFFVCFFGIPIPGICPESLYFNPGKSECDDPENVICHDATEPTTETPNFCDGVPNGQLFDNPESCSHFFICINNVPQPGVCPLGLYFNEVSRSCDPSENVNCFPPTIPTEIPTVPSTEAPTTTEELPSNACVGINDGTLVNNPRYCDAFFFCFGENAIKGTCPPPSLFNSILGICDLPENVNCDMETTTTIIETTTKPVDICYGHSDFTFLNDPRKCADHFICFNGQSTPRSCPDGLYFDPSISICVRSETVNCDDNESTTIEVPSTTVEASTTERSTTTEEGTSTALPIPENCPSTGVQAIPNPQRCSRFRLCASGLEFELACPPDEHFVFARAGCLPREIANCTIPIPVCDPILSAQHLLILHHPHYCDRFFLCFIGSMTPLQCAEGQHFDLVSQQCTSIAIANCEL